MRPIVAAGDARNANEYWHNLRDFAFNAACLAYVVGSLFVFLIATNAADYEPVYHAVRQWWLGSNPYDTAFWSSTFGTVMHYYYPAWFLPVVLPVALLPWPLARIVWFVLMTGCLLLGSHLLWRRTKPLRWTAWMAITVYLSAYTLMGGQPLPLILLSLALASPLLLPLDLIKPHLVLLYTVALLRRKPLLGVSSMAVAVIIGSALVPTWGLDMLHNARSFENVANEAAQTSLMGFMAWLHLSATIGWILYVLLLAPFVLWLWKLRNQKEILPAAILVGLVFAPRLKVYDMALYLFPLAVWPNVVGWLAVLVRVPLGLIGVPGSLLWPGWFIYATSVMFKTGFSPRKEIASGD